VPLPGIADESWNTPAGLRRRVPFVAYDHQRTVVAVDQTRQSRVLISKSLSRIDYQGEYLGTPNGCNRASDRVMFKFSFNFGRTPDPGRVD
jgi:hypothetical protein